MPPNSTDSTGTSGGSPPSSAKSTLTVGLSYLPADPDPAVGSDGTPAILWRQVFDTLTTYTGKSTKPVADLATSWQSSNTAKQWTFKIAAGKKFHDGSAVTAKAVCDNYDFWNSATGEKQQQLGDWGYFFYGFKGQPSDRYSSCKASGDSAVMTFSKPMPSLPDIVSQITFSIHSPASLRGTKPVGSGPYKWVSGTEQRVQLAAVAPGITPKITMLAISDPHAGASVVASGAVDLYYSLSPDRPAVQSGATIAAPPADHLATIDLLGAKGPLADATTRTAILSALDTGKITKILGADLTKSALPGVFNGPPLAVPVFNAAAAKKLLQGKKIGTLVMELRGGDAFTAGDQQIGQLIKAQLAAVGVTLKLVVAPSVSAYYTAIQDGKSDLWVARIQAYSGDLVEIADAYAQGAVYQAAVPAASKAAFDTKMNAALDGPDPQARSSLSVALLSQLVAEHSVLPLFSYGGSWVVSDAVSGFRTTAFNQVQLQGVTVH
ncbi:MAG: ABC transporter substrate-binding protein [Nakamurella sp.]